MDKQTKKQGKQKVRRAQRLTSAIISVGKRLEKLSDFEERAAAQIETNNAPAINHANLCRLRARVLDQCRADLINALLGKMK